MNYTDLSADDAKLLNTVMDKIMKAFNEAGKPIFDFGFRTYKNGSNMIAQFNIMTSRNEDQKE